MNDFERPPTRSEHEESDPQRPGRPTIDLERLVDKVEALLRADIRLERARGVARPARR